MTKDSRVLHHRPECPDTRALEDTTIAGRRVELCQACKRYRRADLPPREPKQLGDFPTKLLPAARAIAPAALRPHDPRDRLTKVTTGAYDPGADTHFWHAFLASVLPDGAERDYLCRVIGQSVYGGVREHLFPVLIGSGANGKGTTYGAITNALGDYATVINPEILMVRERGGVGGPEMISLLGARLVIGSETEDGRKLDEATMKRLTGGDELTARRLYREPVTWRPSHQLVYVTNALPTVKGNDPAVWRRLRVVPFDVVVPVEQRGIGQAVRNGQEAGELPKRGERGGGAFGPGGRERRGLDENTSLVRDFFPSAQERVDTYVMTDGVSDDQFEEVLTEAREEGNLSRANVVRKIKDQGGSPQTRAQRADLIEVMAGKGMASAQMAPRVGVSEETVRQIARDFSIDIPADRLTRGTRRIDSIRVARSTVETLDRLGYEARKTPRWGSPSGPATARPRDGRCPVVTLVTDECKPPLPTYARKVYIEASQASHPHRMGGVMTTDSRVLHHRPECPDRSAVEITTIGGRAVQLCQACKRYSRVDRLVAETKPPVATVPKARPPVSRYRCRTHPETPVTWRGDGCVECPTSRRRRPRPKGATE